MVRGGHVGKFAGFPGAQLVFDNTIREESFRIPDLCQVGKKIGNFFKVHSQFRFIGGELDDSGFIDDIYFKLLSKMCFSNRSGS